MLATMRPSHAYQHTTSVHSRPDSRASSHSNSPAVSPARAKVVSGVASGVSGKKAVAHKRLLKQQHDASQQDFSKIPEALPASQRTPGLITLTKPLSSYESTAPSPSNKFKKNRSRQQRSSSPPTDPLANSASTPSKPARNNHRKKKDALPSNNDEKCDSSIDLLSKSAPSGSISTGFKGNRKLLHHNNSFESPSSSKAAEAANLTWQQELFKVGSTTSKSSADLSNTFKKSAPKRNSSHVPTSKHDGNLAQPQQVQANETSSLTWQQELLGSKKRNGPHFDVFVDARDAETFGAGLAPIAETKGRRRARAGSVGSGAVKPNTEFNKQASAIDVPLHIDDLFNSTSNSVAFNTSQTNHRRGQSASASALLETQPSTPAKKQVQHAAVAAAIAYAGPNFHNSPSPASLPAPKFSNRSAKNGGEAGTAHPSSLGASSGSGSGSEDEDYEIHRNIRGATVPVEIGTPSKSSPTASSLPSYSPQTDLVKPAVQPGATVESLLVRILGGAKLA